jgi:co-chaperonin GroES (HSP10)
MSERPIIKQVDISPFFIQPHGDRLLVEAVELDNTIDANGHTLYTAPMNNRDRDGKLTEEWKRGFCAGIVIHVGDGHVLTTPIATQAVTMKLGYTKEDIEAGALSTAPGLRAYDPQTGDGIVAVDSPARVPMPWKRGDVVLIERLAKREITLNGRVYAMVDQMDVLATAVNLKYVLRMDGSWVSMNEALEQGLVTMPAGDAQPQPETINDAEVPVA